MDEPVYLCAYDPHWPALFAAEAERIRRAVPAGVAIEHIGSTAVPGLLAKPVIDIMLGAEPSDAIRKRLTDLGYEDMGEAGVRGRLYFRLRGVGSFNIALVDLNGVHWVNNLILRDYLRTHPDQAEEYAQAKRTAIDKGADSLLSYSESKSATVARLIDRALSWSARGLC